MDHAYKENYPFCNGGCEDWQLPLQEAVEHAEKENSDNSGTRDEDAIKPKKPKPSCKAETKQSNHEGQERESIMFTSSVLECQNETGLPHSKFVQLMSPSCREVTDILIREHESMAIIQSENTEQSNTTSESSLLKLQALEADLCSTFLSSQEDGAQVQGHKDPCSQLNHSCQADETSSGGPISALKTQHNESDYGDEVHSSPGPSQLLHHITDGGNPLLSPRCSSFSQSQRFNSDPESAPSPPSSQLFMMSRSSSRGNIEDATEPISVAELTKHIQNLKRKIRKYEERFEKEKKYKPSHSDKTANPDVLKWMNDLAKGRKHLKELKLKLSEEANTVPRTEQRSLLSESEQQEAANMQQTPSVEETAETAITKLKEKREQLGLPENLKDMTQKQMAMEKVTLQKCLLYFEGIHGRPVTKQERHLMKPLYDRYRIIKQLLSTTSSISTIEEEGSEEESSQRSPELFFRPASNASVDDYLCQIEEDNEPAFVSPLDEKKTVKQPTFSMSNLHEATMPELLQQHKETRADKKRLRKALREFEEQFLKQTGRNAQKEDLIPMAEEYYEYKHIKAKLKLLEVLISKQDVAKSI
ncbi:protein FAM13C [Latimeria chalumnae]|uniref:protein FAM13C n=1 Tax=Latimeria chalumnae TaxID=7897 RepID=UPI00313D8EE3